MPTQWQEVVSVGLRMTGIPWFLREIVARHKITIINYHDPLPEVFERHVAFFSHHYSFISIDQLAESLNTRSFRQLPPKPLLLTLDDGSSGNSRLFPIIEKYNVPAVLYAVAGVVDTNRGFWFDRLDHRGKKMRQLKSLPDHERRKILQKEYGHTDERPYRTPASLSAEQLHEFLRIGGTVGSHTLFHPLLAKCEDEVGRFECAESRRLLEAMLDSPVWHFALPAGSRDERTRNWLTEAGYRTCRSTTPGWVTPSSDPLDLKNFGISDDSGLHRMIVQACGLWDVFKSSRRTLLRLLRGSPSILLLLFVNRHETLF